MSKTEAQKFMSITLACKQYQMKAKQLPVNFQLSATPLNIHLPVCMEEFKNLFYWNSVYGQILTIKVLMASSIKKCTSRLAD